MDQLLCANGCGFYGTAQNQNLCSKCFKEYQKQNPIIKANAIKETICDSPLISSMAGLSLANENDSMTKMSTEKNRCTTCNKKLGLLGFNCRCGNMFCGSHRYPEEHRCNVDLKTIGRHILIKQNPLCKADKLQDRI